jgi:lysophospholipase L1-like esterase
MRHLLPELIALPLLPFLIAQGKRTRRITPRLPEAAGPIDGITGSKHGAAPLSLLTLGESPVAGVGVQTHEEAITGQLAQALATRLCRPVAWRACGKNGVTVRQALEQVVPTIPEQQVDVALVAFGVNDTTAFHSVQRWRTDLRSLLQALEKRCAPRLILLSGVPAVAHFPALPQPLRWVMGMKAHVLDVAARDLAASLPRTRYVALPLDPADKTMMASDGYHPSAKGCTAWAQLLTDACGYDAASASAKAAWPGA